MQYNVQRYGEQGVGVVEVLALFTEDSKGTAKGMEFSVRFFSLGFSRKVVNGESGGGDGQSDEQVDEHFLLHAPSSPVLVLLYPPSRDWQTTACRARDARSGAHYHGPLLELKLTRLSTDKLSLDGHVVHV
jgi:hypothetical protein